MHDHDMRHTVAHGASAFSLGVIGAITSFLPQIEQWLRVLLLLLSVVATTISVWKLIRGVRRKGHDDGAAMPAWTALAAILLCFMVGSVFTACTPANTPPSASPPAPAVEEKEVLTTVRGSDGRLYRLIRKARPAAAGEVADFDLWQPLGQAGSGLPAYTRQLQVPGSSGDPVFTRVGDL